MPLHRAFHAAADSPQGCAIRVWTDASRRSHRHLPMWDSQRRQAEGSPAAASALCATLPRQRYLMQLRAPTGAEIVSPHVRGMSRLSGGIARPLRRLNDSSSMWQAAAAAAAAARRRQHHQQQQRESDLEEVAFASAGGPAAATAAKSFSHPRAMDGLYVSSFYVTFLAAAHAASPAAIAATAAAAATAKGRGTRLRGALQKRQAAAARLQLLAPSLLPSVAHVAAVAARMQCSSPTSREGPPVPSTPEPPLWERELAAVLPATPAAAAAADRAFWAAFCVAAAAAAPALMPFEVARLAAAAAAAAAAGAPGWKRLHAQQELLLGALLDHARRHATSYSPPQLLTTLEALQQLNAVPSSAQPAATAARSAAATAAAAAAAVAFPLFENEGATASPRRREPASATTTAAAAAAAAGAKALHAVLPAAERALHVKLTEAAAAEQRSAAAAAAAAPDKAAAAATAGSKRRQSPDAFWKLLLRALRIFAAAAFPCPALLQATGAALTSSAAAAAAPVAAAAAAAIRAAAAIPTAAAPAAGIAAPAIADLHAAAAGGPLLDVLPSAHSSCWKCWSLCSRLAVNPTPLFLALRAPPAYLLLLLLLLRYTAAAAAAAAAVATFSVVRWRLLRATQALGVFNTSVAAAALSRLGAPSIDASRGAPLPCTVPADAAEAAAWRAIAAAAAAEQQGHPGQRQQEQQQQQQQEQQQRLLHRCIEAYRDCLADAEAGEAAAATAPESCEARDQSTLVLLQCLVQQRALDRRALLRLLPGLLLELQHQQQQQQQQQQQHGRYLQWCGPVLAALSSCGVHLLHVWGSVLAPLLHPAGASHTHAAAAAAGGGDAAAKPWEAWLLSCSLLRHVEASLAAGISCSVAAAGVPEEQQRGELVRAAAAAADHAAAASFVRLYGVSQKLLHCMQQPHLPAEQQPQQQQQQGQPQQQQQQVPLQEQQKQQQQETSRPVEMCQNTTAVDTPELFHPLRELLRLHLPEMQLREQEQEHQHKQDQPQQHEQEQRHEKQQQHQHEQQQQQEEQQQGRDMGKPEVCFL
ncbi:hypothetical protein ACSSS7_000271 [Eimeria intestinalis]